MFLYIKNLGNFDQDIHSIKKSLESTDDNVKINALKYIIISILSGADSSEFIMPIFRNVISTKNKNLKKLILLFIECIPKTDNNGNLKQEVILVWYLNFFY